MTKLPGFTDLPLAALAVFAMLTAMIGIAPSSAESPSADSTRTVLITGANRGIGLELARQYGAAGWQVIGTARRPEAAEMLKSLGAMVMQLDVTDQKSVERLASDLGNRPIDMLINNAGILPVVSSITDVDFETFERILDVNTTGPVRVTQALLPNLHKGLGKVVINMTSSLGSIGANEQGGFYGYRESKAALNMFTKTLAAELGPKGFTCIVMHPGWVQTDMGGPNAPTPVEQSVSGIRKVIAGLSDADNGTYWTFEGETMPW